MASLYESLTPYFYMHLHITHNLGVLIPFTSFQAKFLAIVNVSPLKCYQGFYNYMLEFGILPHRWSILLFLRDQNKHQKWLRDLMCLTGKKVVQVPLKILQILEGQFREG